MRTLYRAGFQLGQAGDLLPKWREVAAKCIQWAIVRPGIDTKFPSNTIEVEEQEVAPGTLLAAGCIETELEDAWALRFSHPDTDDPDDCKSQDQSQG